MILGHNHSIGDFKKDTLQLSTRHGDEGGLDVLSALVVSGAATRPGDEILERREHGHISDDLGEDSDGLLWGRS